VVLASHRPVCFVPAVDLDRAQAFYAGTLGLELLYDDGFARVLRLGDATLRLTRVESLQPQPFTVLGWEVDDIGGTLAQLDVEVERFDWIPQDERGVWTTPSGALVAWFRDSEGNLLSVTQPPR
jgi:catechol 2,3-dioxygenase-like lactoylglutathione lyase family enzyme